MHEIIKVALVGQPNVGKSELINAISGANFKVGNFPGVTVEKKEAIIELDGYTIIFNDLPGLYALNAYGPDEETTKSFLLNDTYDIILNVIESSAIAKNLDLTLQLLELNKKTIITLNMIDEVQKNGGEIDHITLSKDLGVPVIPISAREKKGIESLLQKILEMHVFTCKKHHLSYSRHIENTLENLGKILSKDETLAHKSRFYALRLLEEDKDIYRLLHDRTIFLELYDVLLYEKRHLALLEGKESSLLVLIDTRYAINQFLCQKSVKLNTKDLSSPTIDGILINQWLGLPIFFGIMWLLFQMTFIIGEIPLSWIETLFETLSLWTKENLPNSFLTKALSEGVIPSLGAVIGFLPNIIILFLGINLLEQTGYMARTAYLLDGIFKRFGLHGKSFIPLVTGYGCSIPAYIATKALKNPKDKLITMMVIGFFSCSARLPVYVLFISAFFDPDYAGTILYFIYIIGALIGLLSAKLLRSALFLGEREPFVMEMPTYRLPSLKALLKELQIRSVLFLKRAGLFIGTASLVIWFLSSYPINTQGESFTLEKSYIGMIGKSIEPIFTPLGFDWKMSVAAITGLAAKEVAVGTLAALNAIELSNNEETEGLVSIVRETINFKAAIAFLILMMIYSPCIAAMGTFFSEIKEAKWRLLYLILPNIMAWLLAFMAVQVLTVLGF